ncbi:target of Myb protein 1-like isoform X3 [Megalops cyprinoides]|uniref:target of Myb protein 1-like isoform X3 n=1 Tax=Megalops cyprinoides TaxID=118141 RepID=UPI00186470B5|nr:target of Myb protein 1-like isoform X3 [Megalops cyprinoides]
MDFLIGSPFSTPVGQRIEHATSSTLQGEDWGLNMEICDIINETDEGPKDAVRAIKKRIVGNKNFREVMLALTVLEACVKNCGHRFHVLVSTREFVEGVLVRAILPKNNPPMVLHDRVLSLIQSVPDSESSVSVSTPPSTRTTAPAPTQLPVLPQSITGPLTITPEQAQKLRAELDVVRGNLTVMSEMLNELTPGHAQQSDAELLQQLYTVCRSMQERVVELIPNLTEETLIGELLVVNDDLNNNFIRYHRFERLCSALNAAEQTPNMTSANLIDLTPEPSALNQPAQTATPAHQPISQSAVSSLSSERANLSAGGDEEFDMFAQTRGSSLAEQRKSVRYEDPGAVEGLAGALDTRLQVTGAIPAAQPTTMDDIEKWLSGEVDIGSTDKEGVTSEEFDKFLEERVKVSDQSSSQADPTFVPTRSLPQATLQHERSHDQLFTL